LPSVAAGAPILESAFNLAGDLIWERDAQGNETTHVVDNLGRERERIDAAGKSTRFDYNAFGELVSV
jgi:YD repeat-containing protein